MKHIFIVNPAAGKGRALSLVKLLEGLKLPFDDTSSVFLTKKPGHAVELASQYFNDPGARIYSVGGDGTLNEVINGIAGGKCSLGVIPAGSGNDFARMLYSMPFLPEEIIKGIPFAEERKVDLVGINDKFYINISSVGFDAQVADTANRFKKYPFFKRIGYAAAVFFTLTGNKARQFKIIIDGNEINNDFLMVTVSNGRYYGGGMMPAPGALINDGMLDICLIAHKKKHEIIKLFPLYAKGRHEALPGVQCMKGRKVDVVCSEDTPVNIDGEVFFSKSISYSIIPEGIRVAAPVT